MIQSLIRNNLAAIIILGGIIMRVVNPLNKTPMSSETMVNGGCHCVCTSGRNVSYAAAWLPVVPNCQCSCGGGTTNKNGNYQLAYNAAHQCRYFVTENDFWAARLL